MYLHKAKQWPKLRVDIDTTKEGNAAERSAGNQPYAGVCTGIKGDVCNNQ